jgi:hypothetical protein
MEKKFKQWIEKSSKVLNQRIDENNTDFTDLEEELELRKELYSSFEGKEKRDKITKNTILGDYSLVGGNSSDAPSGYVGVLNLSREEYQIKATWIIEGHKEQIGYGLMMDNILCLNFSYEAGSNIFDGLVAFHFLTDSCIYGVWTEQINDALGFEMGRKLKSKKINPLNLFGMN